MKKTLSTTIAVVLIGIIVFSAVSISQDLFKNTRFDLTERKLYSLSDGTKAILAKLNQPIKMKLYYTRTAALKGPDQIRFFNNYASYLESLLNEYVAASNGMVQLEVIDPRPFTDEEADAMRYGLRRIPMSQEESFIFGLVVQTQFGVTKTIPLFSPDRQNFVEYDISYLIDTATRREKKNIGVLSSLSVMGEVSDYMARMMAMQGRRPPGPWTIIEQLRTKYNVTQIETNTDKIEDIDILLIIHPKDLEEKTLFAVDQFLLNGGSLIIFIDPYCLADQPKQQMGMMQADQYGSSNLKQMMKNWGLQMPDMTFAGDRKLALLAAPNQIPEKIIAFLGLTKADGCFNKDSVITAQLNEVRVIFAGALQEIALPTDVNNQIEKTPLMSTTSRGNTWTVDNPYELTVLNPSRLMEKFFDGAEPVHMAYLLSGRFPSAFTKGIKIKNDSDPNAEPNLVTGLAVSKEDSQIVIFSDVDFITDQMAYDETFFGKIALGDNANIVLNAIDSLGGSADLIAVRSRGEVTRGFEVVDAIETEAEKSVQQQENAINAEIAAYRQELEKILSTAQQGQEEVIGSSILQKRAELEVKIREAEKRLREVRRNAYQGIEKLGNRMRDLNTLPGPILILLLAMILGIYRSTKKKHYVSHKSDA
jgi:ABC-2 type transport system permease protein